VHDHQAISEDGIFQGYAALFGSEDLEGEIVVKGAFQSSLAKRSAGEIKMLYQHDATQPVGKWLEIAEDEVGLFVRGHLLLDLPKGRELFHLIGASVLTGLSIGYRTIKSAFTGTGQGRALYEVDLWEVSLVTFPMHPGARIVRRPPQTDMRCALSDLKRELDARFLL